MQWTAKVSNFVGLMRAFRTQDLFWGPDLVLAFVDCFMGKFLSHSLSQPKCMKRYE